MTEKANPDEIMNRGIRLCEQIDKLRSNGYQAVKDCDVLMNGVFKLFTGMFDSIKNIKNRHVADVSHFLLTRAMKHYESMRILILHGSDQDAMAILRDIIATELNLIYMAEDLTRVERFREWIPIHRFKNAELHKEFKLDQIHPPDVIEQVYNAREAFELK